MIPTKICAAFELFAIHPASRICCAGHERYMRTVGDKDNHNQFRVDLFISNRIVLDDLIGR
jgi:hypothetical protein